MKFVFLDIDGVLNHELFFKNRKKIKNVSSLSKIEQYIYCYIDKEKILLLNDIVEEIEDIRFVISSSHRVSYTVKEFQEIFKTAGFKGKIIGKTPKLYFTGVKDYNYSVPRGCEIKAWLEMNKGIVGDKMSKVKYVIFDDDSDMLLWQRENYFRVDTYCGLTYNVIYRAIQYLKK